MIEEGPVGLEKPPSLFHDRVVIDVEIPGAAGIHGDGGGGVGRRARTPQRGHIGGVHGGVRVVPSREVVDAGGEARAEGHPDRVASL